jgi:uncharacterized membrane protein HdeD (DUF308 family)
MRQIGCAGLGRGMAPHEKSWVRDASPAWPPHRSEKLAVFGGTTLAPAGRGGANMEVSRFLIIRGVVALVAGVIAFGWPGVTIAVLVGIFAAYAVIDGITNLFLPFSGPGRAWVHVLQGIVGIAAGVLTFFWPGITALVLILFIAARAIVVGVLEIVAAIRLRRVIHGEWLLGFSGLVSILFGLLVVAFPVAGAVGISWMLGTYAIFIGLLLTGLGIRLRTVTPAAA